MASSTKYYSIKIKYTFEIEVEIYMFELGSLSIFSKCFLRSCFRRSKVFLSKLFLEDETFTVNFQTERWCKMM